MLLIFAGRIGSYLLNSAFIVTVCRSDHFVCIHSLSLLFILPDPGSLCVIKM